MNHALPMHPRSKSVATRQRTQRWVLLLSAGATSCTVEKVSRLAIQGIAEPRPLVTCCPAYIRAPLRYGELCAKYGLSRLYSLRTFENRDHILSERYTRASTIPELGSILAMAPRTPPFAHHNFLPSLYRWWDGELEFCRYPALPYSHSLP